MDSVPSSSTAVNGLAANGEKSNKDDDSHIQIRIITSDNSNEVHFRLKEEVKLGRMKRAYAKRLGQDADELRFVFEGHRITDDDTPKSLGMINHDVVEIYQERTGGGM